MRNIVFIPNIDLGNGRSDKYSYCINSWKYCDKNDCELLLLEDLLLPVEQMRITWQRYYVFDVLDNSNIDYNQVLVVDADTIVHPECPNFFNETDGKYKRPSDDIINKFIETLSLNNKNNNFQIMVRWSNGLDIDAGCGQLAITNNKGE